MLYMINDYNVVQVILSMINCCHCRSLNWQCDTCGKVVNLLSKNSVKKPITEEEQTMLNTIALKVNNYEIFNMKIIF